MDKKLESRIARLEKLLSRKNEGKADVDWDAARDAINDAIDALERYDSIVDGQHGSRYVTELEADARVAVKRLLDHVKHYRTGSDAFHV